MKIVAFTIFVSVLVSAVLCEDKASPVETSEGKEEMVLLEVDVSNADQGKLKRQVEGGRLGATQHIYGAAPGHYVLRTPSKEGTPESDAEYLGLLRQLEQGGLQPAAAQPRQALQQYLIPRHQQGFVPSQLAAAAEPKLIHIQPAQKRPLYPQSQLALQQAYQVGGRIPLMLRQSQAVRPSPVQGIYTSQGFIGGNNNHALHEARVQAALSVADDKPTGYAQSQSILQYSPRPQPSPLGDSSFEKELAQLVAANQAAEQKAKVQPQQQQVQYIQAPQKQYSFPQPKPKQYAFRPEVQQAPRYSAPALQGRSKAPAQPLPQQYLIETTKPQQTNLRQVVKARPQYAQAPVDDSKYYEYQTYQDRSPMKVVASPQLQRVPVPQQYKYLVQKEAPQPAAPAYLQYYQSIKAEADEASSANDVKLETYTPRFAVHKPQPSSPSPTEEQVSYVRYQPQPKQEDPSDYVRYKAAKPQLTSQYSSEDDSLIRSLLQQSLQKSSQGLSGFSTSKTASTETKPRVQPSSETSHSSIFVSKALVPKKQPNRNHAPVTAAPEPVQHAEQEEEQVQTVRLPPPKNNKVYTQDEFQALVDAGYSVTPIPVTDDDDKPNFSPAPPNYPGHIKYQGHQASATEQPQIYQKHATADYSQVSPAPRLRKYRRPVIRPQYGLLPVDSQEESESQSKLTYAHPLDTQETSNYGMRKQSKSKSNEGGSA